MDGESGVSGNSGSGGVIKVHVTGFRGTAGTERGSAPTAKEQDPLDFLDLDVEEFQLPPLAAVRSDEARRATELPRGDKDTSPVGRDVLPSERRELQSDDLVEVVWADGLSWVTRAGDLAKTPGFKDDKNPGTLSLRADLFEVKPDNVWRGSAAEAARDAVVRGGTNQVPTAIRLLRVKELQQKSVSEVLELYEKHAIGKERLARVSANFELGDEINYAPSDKASAAINVGAPLLLLLHGTASSTKGAFSDLATSQVWGDLARRYGSNIAAFEHRTLSVDPIDNAIALVRRLPQGAKLHILSHSRGGLVGELLAAGGLLDSVKWLDGGRPDEQFLAKVSELAELTRSKKIIVERFARVACPSRGTLLLSGRIENFLNLLVAALSFPGTQLSSGLQAVKWLMRGLVHLGGILQEVPGLAAMRFDNPLLALLKRTTSPTRETLLVVSGDSRREGFFGRLRSLVPELIFDGENDFVVETKSMFGGMTRTGVVFRSSHRDQPKRAVTHFTYFSHPVVQADLGEYLMEGTLAAGELARNTATEERGIHGIAEIFKVGPYLKQPSRSPNRPVVVLLPGIMGSHLAQPSHGDPVWLSFPAIASGGMQRLGIDEDVKAVHLIDRAYGRLVERLAERFDVILFPYDWRKTLEDAAAQLADLVQKERNATGQPVHLLAHSMGGLVARTMIAQKETLWEQLKRKGGRFVMLGTPNHGSYVIPRLLLGEERILHALALCDFRHDLKQLLAIVRKYPGALDMLPQELSTDGTKYKAAKDSVFFKHDHWTKLSKAFEQPDLIEALEGELTAASTRRDNLQAKILNDTFVGENMFYVAGKDPATPSGILVGERNEFTFTGRGDGRVTWRSGQLPTVPTYWVDATHGDLADTPEAFDGIMELLARGSTERLPSGLPAERSEPAQAVAAQPKDASVEDREWVSDPIPKGTPSLAPLLVPDDEELASLALGARVHARTTPTDHVVELQFRLGNLLDLGVPVLRGQYRGAWFGEIEEELDLRFEGLLRKHVAYGLQPGVAGATSMLTTPGAPSHVVLIGLGLPGELSPAQLKMGVRNALLKLATDTPCDCSPRGSGTTWRAIDVATTLIGTGRGGVSARDSLNAILEGAIQANRRLRDQGDFRKARIRKLIFVEHVQELAIEAAHLGCSSVNSPPFSLEPGEKLEVRGLLLPVERLAADATPDARSIFWKPQRPREVMAARRWQSISVLNDAERSADPKLGSDGTNGASKEGRLLYLTHGGRARADSLVSHHSPRTLDACVERLSTSRVPDDGLVHFLLGYLVPDALRPGFRSGSDLLLSVEPSTARVPWELFLRDPESSAGAPVTHLSMLRQLRGSVHAPPGLTPSTQGRALVISHWQANPDLGLPALDFVEMEHKRVAEMLDDQYESTPIPSAENGQKPHEPHEVWNALGQGSYEVVHLAGHGFFNADNPRESGLRLANGHVVSARELGVCDQPPALLFANACHLGQIAPHGFAAGFAQACIERGVLAVVVAGWAVADAAADAFSKEFYTHMLAGETFGYAVSRARLAAYQRQPTSNTWAAYQCYGDPEFVLPSLIDGRRPDRARAKRKGRDAKDQSTRAGNKACGTTSNANGCCWVYPIEVEDELCRLRETLTLGSTRTGVRRDDVADAVTALDQSLAPELRTGGVLFRTGLLLRELGKIPEAIAVFEEAKTKRDCPIAVLEELTALRPPSGPGTTPTGTSPAAPVPTAPAPVAPAPAAIAPEGIAAEAKVGTQTIQVDPYSRRDERKKLLERILASGFQRARLFIRYSTVSLLDKDDERDVNVKAIRGFVQDAKKDQVSGADIMLEAEFALFEYLYKRCKGGERFVRSDANPTTQVQPIDLGKNERVVVELYRKSVLSSRQGTVHAEALQWLLQLRAVSPPDPAWHSLLGALIAEIQTKALDPDDPQRGLWGGKSTASGRILAAQVHATDDPDWFQVVLSVKSAPDAPLLDGDVIFHLHPTFPQMTEVVQATNGTATLKFLAWGAFTVGVEADNCFTQLELDLAQLTEAPEKFRAR